MDAPKITTGDVTYQADSDGSSYSDCDPDPEKITVRQSKSLRRNERSARLEQLAQPKPRIYHDLYNRYGWVMDKERAARIRRKLDASKEMTLEQLETVMAERERSALQHAADRQRGRHIAELQTFDGYAGSHLDELFGRVAKHVTKKLCARSVVAASRQPLIVAAAHKRLIDYALEVVDNALAVQQEANRVPDLVGECPKARREERRVRRRVAEEMAHLAKDVLLAASQGGEVKGDVCKPCCA